MWEVLSPLAVARPLKQTFVPASRRLRSLRFMRPHEGSSYAPLTVHLLPDAQRGPGEAHVLFRVGQVIRKREVGELVRHVASGRDLQADDVGRGLDVLPLL